MRQAFSDVGFLSNNFELTRDPIPAPLGFSFGYDYCAEHEYGIKPMVALMGLALASNPRAKGVAARKIEARDRILVVEGQTPTLSAKRFYKAMPSMPVLMVFVNPRLDSLELPIQDVAEGQVRPRVVLNKKQTAELIDRVGAHLNSVAERTFSKWSERGALVIVAGQEKVDALNFVLKGLEEEEGLGLSQGAPGPFRGAGVFLTRLSQMSEEQKQAVLDSDTAHWKLDDTVEATGIHQELKAAGKSFYALKPRWIDEERGEIAYYLNPESQRENHSGWVTLQDLKDWAQGKGVIPTRAAEVQMSAQERAWISDLQIRLSALYGNPYTFLVTWADEQKTQLALSISVGKKGVEAGLRNRQVVPFSELEALVKEHESRAKANKKVTEAA